VLGAFERELTEVKTNREDLNDALQHALGESAAVDYNEPVGPSKRRCTQADSDRAMADNAKHAKQLASVAAKPQVFDGTSSGGRSSNVRDWLMSIEMYFKLMADIIPASQRVNTAATYLKGEALRFWHFRLKMLTPEEQTDMRVFEKALTERFDSANDPVTARYKLDKLRQGKITMRQHVQRFDTLCSYIPDMQDAEKIHRFLTSVRADCASILSSDPSTGARWVQYADLRKYALNHYAHERIFPSGAGDAGVFDQTKDAMREAAEVVSGSERLAPLLALPSRAARGVLGAARLLLRLAAPRRTPLGIVGGGMLGALRPSGSSAGTITCVASAMSVGTLRLRVTSPK
jgi:hypothetical protein